MGQLILLSLPGSLLLSMAVCGNIHLAGCRPQALSHTNLSRNDGLRKRVHETMGLLNVLVREGWVLAIFLIRHHTDNGGYPEPGTDEDVDMSRDGDKRCRRAKKGQ